MKCLDRVQIEELIIDCESEKQFKEHLEDCAVCRELFDVCLEERAIWRTIRFNEVLPEHFTDQVMSSLEHIDLEPPSNNKVVFVRQRRKGRHSFNKNIFLRAAVLLLLVIGSLAVFVQPSVADFIRSMFFTSGSVWPDSGVLQAKEWGLVQHPGIRVEDKGYTLIISEAVADSNRVVIPVLITDSKGHKRGLKSMFDPDNIKVLNEKGQEVGKIGMLSYDSSEHERFDVMHFFITGDIPNEQIIVEGTIPRLGDGDRVPFVQGDWSFRFPLSIKASQDRTFVSPINEQTNTSVGLQITAKQIVRTPSSVRLELVTKLNDAARLRYPEPTAQQQSLMFHLEDAQGEVLYRGNGSKEILPYRGPLAVLQKFDKDSVHYYYYFDQLPYGKDTIRFVLDGFSIPEKSQDQIVLDSVSLKKEAAVFHSQGDEIHILSMDIGHNPNSSKKLAKMSLLIGIKASLANMFMNDQYVLKDEKGNEFPGQFYGSFGPDSTYSPSYLIFDGVDTLPAKATLIRTVVDKYYKEPGWSFLFPKN